MMRHGRDESLRATVSLLKKGTVDKIMFPKKKTVPAETEEETLDRKACNVLRVVLGPIVYSDRLDSSNLFPQLETADPKPYTKNVAKEHNRRKDVKRRIEDAWNRLQVFLPKDERKAFERWKEKVEQPVGKKEERSVTRDPATQPTYDELFKEFNKTHGKVGSNYFTRLDNGKIELDDARRFRETHCQKKYYELVFASDDDDKGGEGGDADGNKTPIMLKAHHFLNEWIYDEKRDPAYLPTADKWKRNIWERFGMYPNAADCPDDEYNLWREPAAAQMQIRDVNAAAKGLLCLLEHLKMLCRGDAKAFDFLLDAFFGHALQHPDDKLGIALCLVGKKGAGKTTVWEIILRLFGKVACFGTDQPDVDVWGNNNINMIEASWCRIEEAERKTFAGCLQKLKGKITDNPVRVRALYCKSVNVPNYTNFFIDTDNFDAIPDEHGERRFFVIHVDDQKIGDESYFTQLRAHINDDQTIRALYECLRTRKGVKRHYFGCDIPVGEYQQRLKDANRSVTDHFLHDLVEAQQLVQTEMLLTNDTMYDEFLNWQDKGKQFERSKQSVMNELGLGKYGTLIRLTREMVGEPGKRKQQRCYVLDLVGLRKRYGIGIGDAAPADAANAPIDCEAEVQAWLKDFQPEAENGAAGAAIVKQPPPDKGDDDFRREVAKRLNEWKVRKRAEYVYMDTIPSEQVDIAREQIVAELRRERFTARQPHPASPSGSGGSSSGRPPPTPIPDVEDDDLNSVPRLNPKATHAAKDGLWLQPGKDQFGHERPPTDQPAAAHISDAPTKEPIAAPPPAAQPPKKRPIAAVDRPPPKGRGPTFGGSTKQKLQRAAAVSEEDDGSGMDDRDSDVDDSADAHRGEAAEAEAMERAAKARVDRRHGGDAAATAPATSDGDDGSVRSSDDEDAGSMKDFIESDLEDEDDEDDTSSSEDEEEEEQDAPKQRVRITGGKHAGASGVVLRQNGAWTQVKLQAGTVVSVRKKDFTPIDEKSESESEASGEASNEASDDESNDADDCEEAQGEGSEDDDVHESSDEELEDE